MSNQVLSNEVYTLQQFVIDAQQIIAQRLAERDTMSALLGPLHRVIEREDCLADLEPNGNPDPERGFPIYQAPDLYIAAVIWQEGSGTPIHNHSGWAIEGIIKGRERNRNYARLDDASKPWYAKLEEVEPSIVSTGETTCLDLPPNDIHAVEIPGAKTLAIHVYGVDLPKQWRYQFDLESGEVKPFRATSSALRAAS